MRSSAYMASESHKLLMCTCHIDTKKTTLVSVKKKGYNYSSVQLMGSFYDQKKKKNKGANVSQWPNDKGKIIHFSKIKIGIHVRLTYNQWLIMTCRSCLLEILLYFHWLRHYPQTSLEFYFFS